MSKKQLIITVRGKAHEWYFITEGDDIYLDEWRADGLEVFVLQESIPLWAANIGVPFMKVYLALNDIFNFRNPFRHKP